MPYLAKPHVANGTNDRACRKFAECECSPNDGTSNTDDPNDTWLQRSGHFAAATVRPTLFFQLPTSAIGAKVLKFCIFQKYRLHRKPEL